MSECDIAPGPGGPGRRSQPGGWERVRIEKASHPDPPAGGEGSCLFINLFAIKLMFLQR